MIAAKAEIQSIQNMGTWELFTGQPTSKPVTAKWIFKTKLKPTGEVDRLKARVVAKGFEQREGVNYNQTFAPVVKHETMRFLFAYAFQFNLDLIHLDVQTAFLNGDLEDEVFIVIPPGFPDAGQIAKLKKALYGLKQSSRAWNDKLVNYLKSKGFQISTADPCLFIFEFQSQIGYLAAYVDDFLLAGKQDVVATMKSILFAEFAMKDLGPVNNIIGIQIERTPTYFAIHQSNKIRDLLTKFGMDNCRGVSTPMLPTNHTTQLTNSTTDYDSQPFQSPTTYREAIGAINFLATCTRPDLAYAISRVSAAMQNPTNGDWANIKRIFRYLQETKDMKLVYSNANQLIAYSDASYAPPTDRKSITGYVIMMNGAAIAWRSKKQPIVVLSSMEAELLALCSATKEVLWFKKLLSDFRLPTANTPITIFEDNQSTISIATNQITSDRSKHIDTKYLFIRERIAKGDIKIAYLPTADMTADCLTKALCSIKHKKFTNGLGLTEI
jgi:hypothetical protein